MSLKGQFDKKLKELLRIRLYKVYKELKISGSGQPPKYSKRKFKDEIKEIIKGVSDILINTREIKKEWRKASKHKKTFKANGWGKNEKKKIFREKYDKKIKFKNCAYVFCNRNKALYVGRTVNGKGRPSSQFKNTDCSGTTNIKIYPTSKDSYVPRLECLAWHKFKPKNKGITPSKPKWSKKCPICKTQKLIKSELEKVLL
ncbi:hypothetical protein HYW99_01715 [Candidatus Woesearchaeota archaeon]|nr:hypothetical protein [Candidatus Woesearchaeota archaeon]